MLAFFVYLFYTFLIISFHMAEFSLKINNKEYKVDVEPDTPVLWVLRDHLNLLGTKYGCGSGLCGACTILLNGTATRSCILPVNTVEDKEITTIEGLSDDGSHPVQQAWREMDVPQCGYCQAGQIMTAVSFLNKNSMPDKKEIRVAMHGNICRCATYNSIEKAVESAANKMNKS